MPMGHYPDDDDEEDLSVIMGTRPPPPQNPADWARERERKKQPVTPETDKRTSYGRFHLRAAAFAGDGLPFPRARHAYWWLLHNVVTHPLIGVLPIPLTFGWHDFTSNRLNKVPG